MVHAEASSKIVVTISMYCREGNKYDVGYNVLA